MREHLLGYLIGALDATDHEMIHKELQVNPQLQMELASLRQSLAPLELIADDQDVPPGLATRTCRYVADQCNYLGERRAQEHGTQDHSTQDHSTQDHSTQDHGTQDHGTQKRYAWEHGALATLGTTELARGRSSMADWIVAVGVVAATALLFMPVIATSREVARVIACQDKLREVGVALIGFSEMNEQRRFPAVPSEGNLAFAGVYGPILLESGHLTDPHRLICPDSLTAQQPGSWRVPTQAELTSASGAQLAKMRRDAGGDFGYNLGVVVNSRHVAPQNHGRTHFALMSDAPNSNQPSLNSLNHGGRGQNVLYEDGRVDYIVDFPGAKCIDHPFRNRNGQVEAGIDNDDAVIGDSRTAPFIQFVNRSTHH